MRILSGIQPSGVLHIGNYFGMMRPAIGLQKEGETFYFIADYHALTSLRDPKALIPTEPRCFDNRTCRKRLSWPGFYQPSRRWDFSNALILIKTNSRAAYRQRSDFSVIQS